MQQKKRKPRGIRTDGPIVVGRVQPLYLGAPGCQVLTDEKRYTINSAVPGDQVRVQSLMLRNKPDAARVLEVIEGSSHRVEPVCTVVQRCGGCAVQEMAYAQQLVQKHKSLVKHLDGLVDATRVQEVSGLSSSYGYRTRLVMPAAPRGRQGGVRFGFYGRGTTRLVEASGCPVQHPNTLATVAMVEQALLGTKVTASETKSDYGWLHGISVRVDPRSGQSELCFSARSEIIPGGDALVSRLSALPGVAGVHLSVSPQRSSYLFEQGYKRLGGAKRTAFHLGGEEFHISPGAFFQTSAEGAELLVEHVLSMMPESFDCLADVYGGVGVFARLSQKRWKRALVIESNDTAIEDLKSYLKNQKKLQIKAISGRVEDKLSELDRMNPDVVLLDPPRQGCHSRVLSKITELRPAQVIYVACGIEALVRDGERLKEAGYGLNEVRSVDMFPHTTHLEVVADFRLRDPSV